MSKNDSIISAITIYSDEPVRVVQIPKHDCIDIRIRDLRITVFHSDNNRMPELVMQSEKEAQEYERRRAIAQAVAIPVRKIKVEEG